MNAVLAAVEPRSAKSAQAWLDNPEELKKLSPTEVRQAVAALAQSDRFDLAVGLCEAALALYPADQEVLAAYALVCEVRQDWPQAEQMLVNLIQAQGADSTAASWLHLVRVLRCQAKVEDAWLSVCFALAKFPEDKLLETEFDSLKRVLDDLSSSSESQTAPQSE